MFEQSEIMTPILNISNGKITNAVAIIHAIYYSKCWHTKENFFPWKKILCCDWGLHLASAMKTKSQVFKEGADVW